MGVSIRLITNFAFTEGGGGIFRVPESVTTMGDLLVYVGKKVGFVFVDVTGERVRKDVEVILNGKDIWFSPAGLKTALRDGDSVEIAQMTLGGG